MSPEERDDAIAAWLLERAGKFNASCAPRALTRLKKGGWSTDRGKYAQEIIAERLTGDSVKHYVNDAMRWGIEQQAPAIAAYEAYTGQLVKALEYVSIPHPRIENLSSSPDGLVGSDGLIEVKCPTTPVFIAWKMDPGIPEDHLQQILLQIAVTGRKWCDFCAYDPRIRGGPDQQLIIRRFIPTPQAIADIEKDAEEFLAEVDAMFDAFVGAPA